MHSISENKFCEWRLKNDGYYRTSCSEIVQAILDINDMQFCPYCGERLQVTIASKI